MSDYPLVVGDVEDKMAQAIGRFIYSFSQLEFAIRLRLGDALKLSEELFDVVVGPYDIATLCNVTREVLLRTRPDLDASTITKLFNRCHALNQRARIIVAHGTWFLNGGGASHFSKNTFKMTSHFEDLDDLHKQTKEAQYLMWHVIASTGWKYDITDVDPDGTPPL